MELNSENFAKVQNLFKCGNLCQLSYAGACKEGVYFRFEQISDNKCVGGFQALISQTFEVVSIERIGCILSRFYPCKGVKIPLKKYTFPLPYVGNKTDIYRVTLTSNQIKQIRA